MKIIHTITLAVLAVGLTSCAAISSAITGQEIPATAVQRAGHPDAPVIMIASSDLSQAEAGPAETIHGLYDAGRAAQVAREVFTESSK